MHEAMYAIFKISIAFVSVQTLLFDVANPRDHLGQ